MLSNAISPSGTRLLTCVFALLVLVGSEVHAAQITSNVVSGIPIITIEGQIEQDDDETFASAISGKPRGTVNLHSQGGRTLAAINIGKMVRMRGYPTIVDEGSVCLSACAMIWLGGTKRLLHSSALLGFHASFKEDAGVKVPMPSQ